MSTQTVPPTTLPPPASPAPQASGAARRFSSLGIGQSRLPRPLLLPLTFLVGLLAGMLVLHLVQAAHGTVATVNGTPIKDRDFYHRLELAAGPQVLQQMVAEEMQVQFAQKQGVLPSSADVQAKMDQAKLQPNFAASLAASHQTEDDLRRSLLVNMAQAAVLTKGVTVTDADVKAFYDKNTDKKNPTSRYYTPDAVQVAVIVTPTQQSANQAVLDLAGGMSFAQAAQKYSKDSSASNGGLLPAILRGRSNLSKIPGLEPQLFNMQVGQQLSAVKIANAYWIIRCVGRAPESTQPFDKVKDEARLGAMLEKGLPSTAPRCRRRSPSSSATRPSPRCGRSTSPPTPSSSQPPTTSAQVGRKSGLGRFVFGGLGE